MVRSKTFAALALVATTAACAQQQHQPLTATHNPSLYSVHQPVVQRTDYVLDLAAAGGGGLASSEAARLQAWFDSLDIGYSDRIWLDESASYGTAAVREDVMRIAGSHGLLLSEGSPVTAGTVQPGLVRVVVTRMSASVPGCPNWAYRPEGGAPISTDSNYGCATNSNLAAMIADPNDLVAGRTGDGSGDATAAIKAVRAYRDRALSGAAGTVKAESVGGQ